MCCLPYIEIVGVDVEWFSNSFWNPVDNYWCIDVMMRFLHNVAFAFWYAFINNWFEKRIKKYTANDFVLRALSLLKWKNVNQPRMKVGHLTIVVWKYAFNDLLAGSFRMNINYHVKEKESSMFVGKRMCRK